MKKRSIVSVIVISLVLAIAGMSLMTTCKNITESSKSSQIIEGE